MQSVLPDFDLVLFGGTGDLAMRKLLPALYRRLAAGQLGERSRVIGAARSELSRDEYLTQVRATCEKYIGKDFDAKVWDRYAKSLTYVKVDAQSDSDFDKLAEVLRGCDEKVRVFFLSTAPDLLRISAKGSP